MSEALKNVLLNMKIQIYPDELIIGNFTSKRIEGIIYPEMMGPSLLFVKRLTKNKTNPFLLSSEEAKAIKKIIPFWFFRHIPWKIFSGFKKHRFFSLLRYYYVYAFSELATILHFAPLYEKVIQIGTDGVISQADEYQKNFSPDTEEWTFYQAIKIIADGLAQFGDRYVKLSEDMAKNEKNQKRHKELLMIADTCRDLLRRGARTFHEALQSLTLTHIAVNLEGGDSTICPGRIDQYLYPYYKNDLKNGIITKEKAKELLACFSIKLCEHIIILEIMIDYRSGVMPNFQAVTIGGVDKDGNDAVNDLSYLILDVMDALRMREPNYQARISEKSPERYKNKIFDMLTSGSNTPSLFYDEVIIKSMLKSGYKLEDAYNYTPIGCVEPAVPGSFSSTNTANFNTPLMLELALNRGRKFNGRIRIGTKTRSAKKMKTLEDVKVAFNTQMKYMMNKMISDLQTCERGQAKYHTIPLSSMLLEGCMESGKDATRGGAKYNFSGIECIGPSDTGDALSAIEQAVFNKKKLSMTKLVKILKSNIKEEYWHKYMQNLDKFGNDINITDQWTVFVIEQYTKNLSEAGLSTRGGKYLPGLFSVDWHDYFGMKTGALPHGRRKGESFASGIAPGNGMDRNGPTALLNSINRIDFTPIGNGINLNLKFNIALFNGEKHKQMLKYLISTYFERGGMQVQLNIIDPKVLIEARDNPNLYPNLMVRVSGYSAYFNDLNPHLKDEIINRNYIEI